MVLKFCVYRPNIRLVLAKTIGNSIVLGGSATFQIMEPQIAVAAINFMSSSLCILLKDRVEVLFLSAQYQANSDQNHGKFYRYRKGASQITEPTTVAPQ
jgi:hypothetical protein